MDIVSDREDERNGFQQQIGPDIRYESYVLVLLIKLYSMLMRKLLINARPRIKDYPVLTGNYLNND